MKNKGNNLPDLDPVVLKIDELKDYEELRPAKTYYISEDWLLVCRFLDRASFLEAKGEDLTIGPGFAVSVFWDGQPNTIEFLEGIKKWNITKSFYVPQDCMPGRVFFNLPLDGWYEYPFVECDNKKRNACICLSDKYTEKEIKIADNIIFGLDKDHYLHKIWLLNIEYRKE
jgi:hypothetical protein